MIKIKRKGAAGRRNAPKSKKEDFVPWVSAKHEDFQDLEDEEREERMTGLLDRYATRKRKRQLSSGSESDIASAQAMGPSQPAAEGGSEVQTIIIPGSPGSGPTDQTEPAGVAWVESKEADLVPSALQVIPPSDQDEGQPSWPKFMRSGLPRPTLPKWIIINCYVPPHGSEPPSGSIGSQGGRGEVYHAPLGAFPLGRVHGRPAKQFVSAHASDAGSCSRHGPWRGLLGECSCRDPKRRHRADYR